MLLGDMERSEWRGRCMELECVALGTRPTVFESRF